MLAQSNQAGATWERSGTAQKDPELLGKDLELPGNDSELSGNDHIEDAEDTLVLDIYMASFPGQARWPGNETST